MEAKNLRYEHAGKNQQIAITLPERMVIRMDELREQTGIRRSAIIQQALSEYFRVQDLQQKTLSNLANLIPQLLPDADFFVEEDTEEGARYVTR